MTHHHRADARSPEAASYRSWYGLGVWKAARRAQLARDPLCRYCKDQGLIVRATVVNHKTPHKGKWQLFIDAGNHESTCKPCHDSLVQSYERTGHMRPVIALDGWPAG